MPRPSPHPGFCPRCDYTNPLHPGQGWCKGCIREKMGLERLSKAEKIELELSSIISRKDKQIEELTMIIRMLEKKLGYTDPSN